MNDFDLEKARELDRKSDEIDKAGIRMMERDVKTCKEFDLQDGCPCERTCEERLADFIESVRTKPSLAAIIENLPRR